MTLLINQLIIYKRVCRTASATPDLLNTVKAGLSSQIKIKKNQHLKTGEYSPINKDHQRMMVDPMFMIVQSLRSFLTAVTTTAVAPIAVILNVFTLIYLKFPEFT